MREFGSTIVKDCANNLGPKDIYIFKRQKTVMHTDGYKKNLIFSDTFMLNMYLKTQIPEDLDFDIIMYLYFVVILYATLVHISGIFSFAFSCIFLHHMLRLTFVCFSQHCFVLDSGYSGIYLWTGKKATNEFKKKVWNAANVSQIIFVFNIFNHKQ